ncbi:hypothetical protein JYK14_16750 [Siccirubricoccus sp. KC 17139]|uniref:Uncharacterized protein n=1 Tax=Siccirubricoccus soli TaxID=2899147 RepID=A0ABT1D7E6_9PROT|nr:hypothetical protein [Siccirubricoccus soli]MCO6417799.1 hypothetical protein [Siccirubricoccus soli]MCP2683934.1 hypothetical protein [Siccirubricoccus soli]
MRGKHGWKAPAGAALAVALALGACGPVDRGTYAVADGISEAGARIGAPWGSMRATPPGEGSTIDRVRGVATATASLQPEPGDVWPAEEAPRATLANPDAALRNIPTYRPGELDRQSAPVGRSQWQPQDPPPVRPAPPDLNLRAPAPILPPVAPPSRSDAGQVIQSPRGTYTTSGGTDRVQSVNGPDGSGTAVRDGNFITLTTPSGTQVVPAPR